LILPRVAEKLVLGILICLALASVASAQSTVTINGTVKDQTGAAVPNATVTATNVETGIKNTAPTSPEGFYTILSIPAGFYDIQASQQGFSTEVRRNQQVLVGTTPTFDFTLQVSSVTQTVEVQATQPELEPTQSTVTSILKTEQLDDLPILSRNFSELASLTPGVQSTSQISVGFAVGGAVTGVTIGNSTQYETGYAIDDIPITKPSDGGLYVALAQDWVQEFSVVSNQAPAEYAGAVSGVVNAITRSGGDSIHGRAYGFFQNSALNAASVNPAPGAVQPAKVATSSQRVGGMVGGPIIKNKLFYFLGYEYYRSLAGAIFNGIPASFSGSRAVLPGDLVAKGFSNLNRQDLGEAKFTYQLSASDSFDLLLNGQFIGEPNIVGGGLTSPYNGNSTRVVDNQESFNWKHIFSPTAINELRVANARNGDDEQCIYAQQVPAFNTSVTALTPYGVTVNGNPTGYYASLAYPGAVSTGTVTVGCNGRWGGEHFIGLYAGIYDTFTKTKGRHEIKFGGQVADPFYGSNQLHSNSDGAYTFPTTATATNGAGLIGTTTGPFDPTNALSFPQKLTLTWGPLSHSYVMVTGWSYGIFAEDTWRVTDALTVNMGIRWDGDRSYSYFDTHSLAPGENPVNNDNRTISPRIGLAWTPMKDKSTVFRGGFGLYYAPTTSTEATGVISTRTNPVIIDTGWASNSVTANPYCISPGGCGSTVPVALQNDLRELMAWSLVNNTYPDLTKTSVTVSGVTYPLPGFTGTIPQSVYNIDQGLRKPAALQVTGGLAHNFTNGLSFTVDYAYIYGFDLDILRNTNINAGLPVTPAGGVNFLNPAYTTYFSYTSAGWFTDKQILAKVRYADHRGDFGQVSYTLGFANSNSPASGDFTIHTGSVSTNPFNYDVDDGPATTDQRHIIAVNGSIRLPGGIQFSPIMTFSTGLPLTPTTTLLANQSGVVTGTTIPVTTPGCQVYYNQCYPARNGVFYGKGSFRGADTIRFDARIQRVFKFGEKKSITPMFEAYNIPNITNLGGNFTVLATSPTFGQPSSSTITKRQLQLGAKFDF
jgi:outer membrane receptor protein involved in Fe transport